MWVMIVMTVQLHCAEELSFFLDAGGAGLGAEGLRGPQAWLLMC